MPTSASTTSASPPDAAQTAVLPGGFDIRLLDVLAAASGDYISIVDRAGCLLYISAGYAAALGKQPGELLGQSLREVSPDDEQAARLHQECAGVFQTGETGYGATRLNTPQGERDIEYTLTPLGDEAGQAAAVMCAGRDVTRRSQAENALRRSADNLDFALNGAQIGTFYCDWPFDKIVWNDTCKEHFFLPHDAEVDFNLFYALLHPEDHERTKQAIDQCMSERVQYDVEYRTVAPDGRWRWINAIGRGFYDAQGTPYRFDGITLDITRRKQAEADMRRQSAEILAINARLQKSMQETHHRVGNSLQLVSAFIDLQALDYADAVPTDNVRHLNTQVRTLSTVHDVLTKEARENHEANMVSVKVLLETLLMKMRIVEGVQQVSAHIEEARIPAKAGTSLAMIVNELILNAVRHGRGAIAVRFTTEDSQARLEVAAEGMHLPADFSPEREGNAVLELVERLARWDLDGSVMYSNLPAQGGAQISVTFDQKVDQKVERQKL